MVTPRQFGAGFLGHGEDPFRTTCAPIPNLTSNLLDYPLSARCCDPLSIVPADIADLLADVRRMFPTPPARLEKFSGFFAGERSEYLEFTARLL